MAGSRRALARGPSIWEAARVPNLRIYCDLLARAQTELAAMPAAAKQAAEEADKLLPGRAAPAVVIARAQIALGAIDAAARSFEAARALDPRSVEDPSTMHDLARVLAKTGKRDEALVVYRALVPRVDLLGTTERRVSVLLEAAHVSMAAEAAGTAVLPAEVGKKAPHSKLDEAVAFLREARQRPQTQLAGTRCSRSRWSSIAKAPTRRPTRRSPRRSGPRRRRGPGRSPIWPPRRTASPSRRSPRGGRSRGGDEGLGGVPGRPRGKGPWAAAARARLDQLKKGGNARAPSGAAGKAAAPPSPGRPR